MLSLFETLVVNFSKHIIATIKKKLSCQAQEGCRTTDMQRDFVGSEAKYQASLVDRVV